MPVYDVTYARLPRSKSKVASQVYADGHWRKLTVVAESEAQAKEIAAKRLAKQFPDRVEELGENGETVVLNEGSLVNGVHDPANAQSNYKLQGITVLKQEDT